MHPNYCQELCRSSVNSQPLPPQMLAAEQEQEGMGKLAQPFSVTFAHCNAINTMPSIVPQLTFCLLPTLTLSSGLQTTSKIWTKISSCLVGGQEAQ